MIIPGQFAPTVTQHPADTPTEDAHHNPVPAFLPDRAVTVVAEYPGNSVETDSAAGDEVSADLVLILTPDISTSSADEWTASDGQRYRVTGQPKRFQNPRTETGLTQLLLRRII